MSAANAVARPPSARIVAAVSSAAVEHPIHAQDVRALTSEQQCHRSSVADGRAGRLPGPHHDGVLAAESIHGAILSDALRETRPMKFGIAFANTGPFAQPGPAVEFARAAEAAGFESLWTVEHVVVPSGYDSPYPYDPSGKMPGGEDFPIPDPLIWLAYLASATSTINLATGILILPQRNPVVLAKELATLDHLSGGRMQLGIGVGWMEEEFDAIGVPFAERGRRTDDHVGAMRALWSQEKASFHGEFTQFDDCISRPQPVAGSIPVHIGGHTDIAARRAGRLGDGFFPGKGNHAELARTFELVRAHGGGARTRPRRDRDDHRRQRCRRRRCTRRGEGARRHRHDRESCCRRSSSIETPPPRWRATATR